MSIYIRWRQGRTFNKLRAYRCKTSDFMIVAEFEDSALLKTLMLVVWVSFL